MSKKGQDQVKFEDKMNKFNKLIKIQKVGVKL